MLLNLLITDQYIRPTFTQDESGFFVSNTGYYSSSLKYVPLTGDDVVSVYPPDWGTNSTIQQTVISPRGDKVAVILQRYGGPNCWQIIVIDKDGSNPHVVDSVETGYGYADLQWSPDGKWLQYRQDNTTSNYTYSSTDIWFVNESENVKFKIGSTQLTSRGYGSLVEPYSSLWSPDSQKISYKSDSEAWLVDVTSRSITRLESFTDVDNFIITDWSWSTTGNLFSLALKSRDYLTTTVRVFDRAGNKKDAFISVDSVTGNSTNNSSHTWINDKFIIMTGRSYINENLKVWLVDPMQNNAKVLYNEKGYYIDGPYISPDNKSFAFYINNENVSNSLWMSDTFGNVKKMYDFVGIEYQSTWFMDIKWSPDSNKIWFFNNYEINFYTYRQTYISINVKENTVSTFDMSGEPWNVWHDMAYGWLSDSSLCWCGAPSTT